jgi:hypothetical protein
MRFLIRHRTLGRSSTTSCSQTRRTRRPARASSLFTLLSLATFLVSFQSQYFLRDWEAQRARLGGPQIGRPNVPVTLGRHKGQREEGLGRGSSFRPR